jgi:phosphonate transport system substrate-binding protein
VLAGLALAGCGSSSSSSSSASTASASGSGTTKNASLTVACPHSPVRFAVEPYDTGPALEKAYKSLASDLQAALHCPVQLIISDSYVAEIEAMRADQLEVGEFGPLGYVLAHQLASAQPIAAFGDTSGKPDTYTAGIWVPKQSSITSLKQLKGKTLALSSTTSTSGGLYPISALVNAGFTCTATSCQGIKIKFAGGHPESRVRGDLPAAFRAKVAKVLLGLSAAQVSTVDKELGTASNGPMVAANDALYNQVRSVANAVHLTTKDLG